MLSKHTVSPGDSVRIKPDAWAEAHQKGKVYEVESISVGLFIKAKFPNEMTYFTYDEIELLTQPRHTMIVQEIDPEQVILRLQEWQRELEGQQVDGPLGEIRNNLLSKVRETLSGKQQSTY